MTESDKKDLDRVIDKAIEMLSCKKEMVECLEKDNTINASAMRGKYSITLIINTNYT